MEMRKSATFALMCAAALGLAACSERTDDNAANTVAAAGDDVQAAGAAVGETAADGADAVGNAAAAAAASTDEMGNKAENARANVEADFHNESVTEAKRD